jgi:hypothetical protein
MWPGFRGRFLPLGAGLTNLSCGGLGGSFGICMGFKEVVGARSFDRVVFAILRARDLIASGGMLVSKSFSTQAARSLPML